MFGQRDLSCVNDTQTHVCRLTHMAVGREGVRIFFFNKKKSAILGDIFCISNIFRIIWLFYDFFGTFEPSSAKIWCKPLTSSLLLATGREPAFPLMLTPPPLPLLLPLRKKYVVLSTWIFKKRKKILCCWLLLFNQLTHK